MSSQYYLVGFVQLLKGVPYVMFPFVKSFIILSKFLRVTPISINYIVEDIIVFIKLENYCLYILKNIFEFINIINKMNYFYFGEN